MLQGSPVRQAIRNVKNEVPSPARAKRPGMSIMMALFIKGSLTAALLTSLISCVSFAPPKGTSWTEHRRIYEYVGNSDLWDAAAKVLLRLEFEIDMMDKTGQFIITKPLLTDNILYVRRGSQVMQKQWQVRVVLWIRNPVPGMNILEIMVNMANVKDDGLYPAQTSGYLEKAILDGIDFELLPPDGEHKVEIDVMKRKRDSLEKNRPVISRSVQPCR